MLYAYVCISTIVAVRKSLLVTFWRWMAFVNAKLLHPHGYALQQILSEDSQTLAALMHVWQFMLRHARTFYAYRSHFVPQMVQTITRLGLQSVSYKRGLSNALCLTGAATNTAAEQSASGDDAMYAVKLLWSVSCMRV